MEAFVSTMMFLAFPAWIYMFVRNRWVFRERQRLNRLHGQKVRALIDAGDYSNPLVSRMEENWFDKSYLGYDQMMLKFWCWDVEKMRK